MKNARQTKILELIEKYDIDTQDTLIRRLADEGFAVTQTTVSRDINQLKLVKGITDKGTYKYVAPSDFEKSGAPALGSALHESVVKIEAAKNILVVKTFSGMANAVAVCIDSMPLSGVVGSVAGDDTILYVMKEDALAAVAEDKLRTQFGLK